jgi:hypothetical protein
MSALGPQIFRGWAKNNESNFFARNPFGFKQSCQK